MHPYLTLPVPIAGARLVSFEVDEPPPPPRLPRVEGPTEGVMKILRNNPGQWFCSRDFDDIGLTSSAASEILGRLHRMGRVSKSATKVQSGVGRMAHTYAWEGQYARQ